jgi:hypothetical protein
VSLAQHRTSKLLEQLLSQRLRECVSDHALGVGVLELNLASLDVVPQEVMSDRDVAGAVGVRLVENQENSALIVLVNSGRLLLRETELLHEIAE